jgi:hypothetical protein
MNTEPDAPNDITIDIGATIVEPISDKEKEAIEDRGGFSAFSDGLGYERRARKFVEDTIPSDQGSVKNVDVVISAGDNDRTASEREQAVEGLKQASQYALSKGMDTEAAEIIGLLEEL